MIPRDANDIIKLSAALLGPCDVDTTTPAWRAAETAGWDMSLVMDSLGKTVAKRMHEHDMALSQAESLKASSGSNYGAS